LADRAIGQVVNEYRRLGILQRTLFVVTADHGMTANRHIVPIHSLYRAVAHSGAMQLNQAYRVSAGSIWLRDPEHSGMLAQKLVAQHFPGVEGALFKVQADTGFKFVPEAATAARLPHDVLQAYLDLADTEASVSGPEVLLPYVEDTTGLPRAHAFKGSHGGFSWSAQHIPLILAGPGVRKGVSHFPAKLVDLAPTVERLLGLQVPNGVDGIILADAVQNSGTAEKAAQSAAEPRRRQDVNALRSHSLKQSKRLKAQP
jgi:arylsulfatase A-like enzyme